MKLVSAGLFFFSVEWWGEVGKEHSWRAELLRRMPGGEAGPCMQVAKSPGTTAHTAAESSSYSRPHLSGLFPYGSGLAGTHGLPHRCQQRPCRRQKGLAGAAAHASDGQRPVAGGNLVQAAQCGQLGALHGGGGGEVVLACRGSVEGVGAGGRCRGPVQGGQAGGQCSQQSGSSAKLERPLHRRFCKPM